MGGAGSRPCTPAAVLERQASENTLVPEDVLAMPEAELDNKLTYFGVDVSAPRPDKEKCVVLVRHPDFWRNNYESHPNKRRVSKWMWVHSRYRDQSRRLLALGEQACKAAKANDVATVKAELTALVGDITKFDGKMQKHGSFEDEQLFKYFLEHVAPKDAACKESFVDLSKQHADEANVKQVVDSCRAALIAARTNNVPTQQEMDNVLAAIQKYHEDLLLHLEMEERTIVGRWLALSADEYRTYRSYVKFPYSFMY